MKKAFQQFTHLIPCREGCGRCSGDLAVAPTTGPAIWRQAIAATRWSGWWKSLWSSPPAIKLAGLALAISLSAALAPGLTQAQSTPEPARDASPPVIAVQDESIQSVQQVSNAALGNGTMNILGYLIGAVVAVVLAVMAALWKLGRWTGSIDSDHKVFTKAIGNLDSKVGKIDEVERKVDMLENKVDKLEIKVDAISIAVHQLIGATKGAVAGAQSPLNLNDFGKKISASFGAKAWAESHASRIRQQVVGMEPYDVQQFCFEYATEEVLTEAELKRAKGIAYDSGPVLFNVLQVLAYELRDCLLDQEQADTQVENN